MQVRGYNPECRATRIGSRSYICAGGFASFIVKPCSAKSKSDSGI